MSLTAKEQLTAMKAQNYIPPKIFVSKQSRGEDALVGYMIPHNPNDSTYSDKESSCRAWGDTTIEPSIIDNKFSTGFGIINQVRRYESDAVYWRVLHPEGFEFEISLENFEYIMNQHVIDRGVIINSKNTHPAEFMLVLQRSNRKWIMVDAQHPEYLKSKDNALPGDASYVAMEQKIKDEAKAVSADLQIGDVVELSGHSYGQYIYMGTVTCGYKQHNTTELEYIRKRVFKSLEKNRYDQCIEYEICSASKKVTKIVRSTNAPISIEDAVAEIKTAIKTHYVNGVMVRFSAYASTPVGVWANKPKKNDVTLVRHKITNSDLTTGDRTCHTPGLRLPAPVVLTTDGSNIVVKIGNIEQSIYNKENNYYTSYGPPTIYGQGHKKSIPLFVYHNHDKELQFEKVRLANATTALEKNTDPDIVENLERALRRTKDDYDRRFAHLLTLAPDGWSIHPDITDMWYEYVE